MGALGCFRPSPPRCGWEVGLGFGTGRTGASPGSVSAESAQPAHAQRVPGGVRVGGSCGPLGRAGQRNSSGSGGSFAPDDAGAQPRPRTAGSGRTLCSEVRSQDGPAPLHPSPLHPSPQLQHEGRGTRCAWWGPAEDRCCGDSAPLPSLEGLQSPWTPPRLEPLAPGEDAGPEAAAAADQPEAPGAAALRVSVRDYFQDLAQKLQTIAKFIISSNWLGRH